MVTKDTTLNELFDAACLSADTIVQSGESFRVKDLFRGVEWSRIPKGFRTKLGSMFFAYVNGEAKNNFFPVGKTPQNQQIYSKR
jgi:hypothetical protein